MGEGFFLVLVIFGVLCLSAVLFGAWLIAIVLRGIGRAFGMILWPFRSTRSSHVQHCQRPNCQAANPDHARFCRRCGSPLGSAHVRLRRVAMW